MTREPTIVFEALGHDGRKLAPRYLEDWDAAAAWLASPDFALIVGKLRSVTFRYLGPAPAAEAGGKRAA